MKETDKIKLTLSRREIGLIYLALNEFKFQTSRHNKTYKNKLTYMSKRFEKLLYVEYGD